MIDVADTADITDDNVTVDSHPEQESAQSVAPPVQVAEDAVQVCPHRPHQVPGPVQDSDSFNIKYTACLLC